MKGGDAPIYVTDESMFDEQYNYDFTDMSDDGQVFKRGKWTYIRPYGWNRVALNVKSSYSDSAWLGGSLTLFDFLLELYDFEGRSAFRSR